PASACVAGHQELIPNAPNVLEYVKRRSRSAAASSRCNGTGPSTKRLQIGRTCTHSGVPANAPARPAAPAGGQSWREDQSTAARTTLTIETTRPTTHPWECLETMMAAMATPIATIPQV